MDIWSKKLITITQLLDAQVAKIAAEDCASIAGMLAKFASDEDECGEGFYTEPMTETARQLLEGVVS